MEPENTNLGGGQQAPNPAISQEKSHSFIKSLNRKITRRRFLITSGAASAAVALTLQPKSICAQEPSGQSSGINIETIVVTLQERNLGIDKDGVRQEFVSTNSPITWINSEDTTPVPNAPMTLPHDPLVLYPAPLLPVENHLTLWGSITPKALFSKLKLVHGGEANKINFSPPLERSTDKDGNAPAADTQWFTYKVRALNPTVANDDGSKKEGAWIVAEVDGQLTAFKAKFYVVVPTEVVRDPVPIFDGVVYVQTTGYPAEYEGQPVDPALAPGQHWSISPKYNHTSQVAVLDQYGEPLLSDYAGTAVREASKEVGPGNPEGEPTESSIWHWIAWSGGASYVDNLGISGELSDAKYIPGLESYPMETKPSGSFGVVGNLTTIPNGWVRTLSVFVKIAGWQLETVLTRSLTLYPVVPPVPNPNGLTPSVIIGPDIYGCSYPNKLRLEITW